MPSAAAPVAARATASSSAGSSRDTAGEDMSNGLSSAPLGSPPSAASSAEATAGTVTLIAADAMPAARRFRIRIRPLSRAVTVIHLLRPRVRRRASIISAGVGVLFGRKQIGVYGLEPGIRVLG